MKPLRYIAIMLVLLSFGACKKSHIIPEGKMVDLLVDVHKGEALIDVQRSKFPDDSLKKQLKQSIYAVHKVTEEDVDSTYAWYGRHIEDYIKLYDKVIARLEDEIKKADREAMTSHVVYAVGDSIDVWDGPHTFRIDNNTPIRNITFHYDADDNWEKGDNYQIQFKLLNQRDGRDKVYTSIYVAYPDGSGEYRQAGASQDGWTRVRLVTDSTRMASSIYGSLVFNIAENEVMYIDSLSLVRTRKLPSTYTQRYSQRHIFAATRDSLSKQDKNAVEKDAPAQTSDKESVSQTALRSTSPADKPQKAESNTRNQMRSQDRPGMMQQKQQLSQ